MKINLLPRLIQPGIYISQLNNNFENQLTIYNRKYQKFQEKFIQCESNVNALTLI